MTREEEGIAKHIVHNKKLCRSQTSLPFMFQLIKQCQGHRTEMSIVKAHSAYVSFVPKQRAGYKINAYSVQHLGKNLKVPLLFCYPLRYLMTSVPFKKFLGSWYLLNTLVPHYHFSHFLTNLLPHNLGMSKYLATQLPQLTTLHDTFL